ncbi:MAG: hypothetical protein HFJ60_01705 [Clostridia bacterium]|jgi:exonuclease SbcD|nr:hypothetical protein [Clostridia bacterium]
MKFVHIADMHFDSPFVNLSDKENLGDIRRLEQRKVFKKVIEYIKEHEIKNLFISGDLYEQKYIKKSTIEYINNLFKEIPETKIFISPGNHDPYVKNSYYNKFYWNENVKIFTSEIEKIELEDVDIYGYGFDNFYCKNSGIENIDIENKNKLNILIIHGSLDGGNIENSEYNPISRKLLKEKGFDYVALGHIHKLDYNQEENQRIVYPGSIVSLGFDELGEHGMIVGDLDKDKINLEFVPLDETEFKLQEIDVTEINFKEDLIEKINELEFKENYLIEIILTGKRNFEIDIYDLYKLISNDKIIKIKNKTKINYDLNRLSNENTLKGLFAKKMLEKLNEENLSDEDKEIIEKAIEIGIEALE